MASLNKVFLMGNLTRDPALRFTPGGSAVCEFGMAINRRFTSANGQEKDETCFVEIIVWGKQAEQCDRFLDKGAPVFIEGRLQFDQWDERETGAKRSRLRVQAERVQFISGKAGGSGRDAEDDGGGDYAQQERPQRPYGGQQQRSGGNYQQGGGGSYRGNSNQGERQQRPFPSDNQRQERPPQQQQQYDEPPRMPEEAFRDDEPEDDIPF